MNLALLITDVGLVVLIWIVQLIIYPGFLYYENSSLLDWHKKYTNRITVIVLPLMLSQAILHGIELKLHFSLVQLLICVLITSCWIVTFLFAVPLHSRITENEHTTQAITSLIKVNWSRTILWTMVFILQFVLVFLIN